MKNVDVENEGNGDSFPNEGSGVENEGKGEVDAGFGLNVDLGNFSAYAMMVFENYTSYMNAKSQGKVVEYQNLSDNEILDGQEFIKGPQLLQMQNVQDERFGPVFFSNESTTNSSHAPNRTAK
ncbi:hypothetical protein ACH5RR_019602 [Cinchona calisaya]|uniref:Uncharacterized protein n=1 Tax=Cinchona calisaya TaxID=153742 RepID=A0ABD2ZR35_9GENT